MITFVDETTQNPLPTGVFVQITPIASTDIVAAGYLGVGGKLDATTLLPSVLYTATFRGTQAPIAPQVFTCSATEADSTVTVNGFRSAILSQSGFTTEQANLWVAKVLGDGAKQEGGNAYALAFGLAAGLSFLEQGNQTVASMMRAQTASGVDLDSWAYDLFGGYLYRYPGEIDALFLQRLITALGPRCTLSAIQKIVYGYFVGSAVARSLEQSNNLGFDILGAFDSLSGGAMDIFVALAPLASLIPTVTVWDRQSNPTYADHYNITPPKFVISIGFPDNAAGWYLDHSFLDQNTYLTDGDAVPQSTTTASFTVPAVGSTVAVVVAGASAFPAGSYLFASDGTNTMHGWVESVASDTLTVLNTGGTASAAGAVVASGATVTFQGADAPISPTLQSQLVPLVNLIKAAGTHPVYLTYQTT